MTILKLYFAGCQQCSWKLYFPNGATFRECLSDHPGYCAQGKQIIWTLQWHQQYLWRAFTGHSLLDTGCGKANDKSTKRRSLPGHNNPLYQWGLNWYRPTKPMWSDERVLALSCPVLVLSLVWKPWWSLLELSGEGTISQALQCIGGISQPKVWGAEHGWL